MLCIDPNGSMDFFNSLTNDSRCDIYLHMIFESYAKKIGFEYIDLKNTGFNLIINIKINSKKQRDFFKGYCKGWALYFQYVLHEAQDDFEMIEYLKKIATYKNLGPINELVEIFQVWFYHSISNIRFNHIVNDAYFDKWDENRVEN